MVESGFVRAASVGSLPLSLALRANRLRTDRLFGDLAIEILRSVCRGSRRTTEAPPWP